MLQDATFDIFTNILAIANFTPNGQLELLYVKTYCFIKMLSLTSDFLKLSIYTINVQSKFKYFIKVLRGVL